MSHDCYQAAYRCRRCGLRFSGSTHTSSPKEAKNATIRSNQGNLVFSRPQSPGLFKSHKCADGGFGQADFLGMDPPQTEGQRVQDIREQILRGVLGV